MRREIEVPDGILELSKKRTVVLTYDADTDEVTIDGAGCSPMEVRCIVLTAHLNMQDLEHAYSEDDD